VIRFLLISVLFFLTLKGDLFTADDITELYETTSQEKVLYLSFKETPRRLVQGQVFSITIKTLSTVQDFKDIEYQLSNQIGIESLNYSLPYRESDEKYSYDTFYFLAKDQNIRLPDFTATLITEDEIAHKPTTLEGKKLSVITLNPKKNFSNIIADSFELLDFKTTNYDKNHNIVVFMAKAKNSDIAAFHLNDVHKQGIESKSDSIFESKLTYYVVIKKEIQNFTFSYFNLKKNDFELVEIPIIVDDDSVTTQTDLKPKDQSKELLKISIAATIAFIGFIFIIFQKKYIYFLLILFPLSYIVSVIVSQQDVCIQKASHIYLLPVYNGTIFETTQEEIYLQKEGETKNFTKVKLEDEKIGWVKNEDICSH